MTENGQSPSGITFEGAKFVVPETHDMLKTLFDPKISKSWLELMILTVIFSNGLLFYWLPQNYRATCFITLYVFWRLSYNFGIGYCLQQQSQNNRLVQWYKACKSSKWGHLLTLEIKSQRGNNYDVDSYPVEFNTWLIFRKFVDLILMNDFTTFLFMVISCSIDSNFLSNQPIWLIAGRLIIGVLFIIFNFWVKVNAHSIIKDYAWYWGDFFFRQINNEELIFDGVFEMFPHPMYSIGYIGYYGFALISKSYIVLLVSIFGHFLQMIFLHYIENPHINKIYGPPLNIVNSEKLAKLKDLKNFDNLKPLIGLFNLNLLRSSDIINCIMVITYSLILPFGINLKLIFYLSIIIKLLESFTINTILILQSWNKYYTKWYLSMDIPVEKSLNNWAILYNSLINLTYSSLFGYNLSYLINGQPIFLLDKYFNLRLFLGISLIFTQIWINSSIIDTIGYFGWFYGDFFVPKSQSAFHFTKVGVYRYLNNPEQIFGVCGVMGVFLIIPSYENLILCGLWVANNFIRLNFIEKPHMIKVYGEKLVLQDSGVTKTVKKHLIPDVIKRLGNDEPKPKRKSSISITDTIDSLIKDLKNSNQKISKQKITEFTQKLNFENSDYKLVIDGLTKSDKNLNFTTIGSPIKISWESPAESHSNTDWIGLYKITQTAYARNKTMISSFGRWTSCDSNVGSFVFEKQRLFWEEGIYEFRFHLAGKHEVVYISEPFEIICPKIQVPTTLEDLDKFTTELKEKVFDNLLNIPTKDDLISKYANTAPDVFDIYTKLGYIILKSTDIKINSKVLLNNDDEEGFTITALGKKLIGIKKILEELSSNDLNDLKKDI